MPRNEDDDTDDGTHIRPGRVGRASRKYPGIKRVSRGAVVALTVILNSVMAKVVEVSMDSMAARNADGKQMVTLKAEHILRGVRGNQHLNQIFPQLVVPKGGHLPREEKYMPIYHPKRAKK